MSRNFRRSVLRSLTGWAAFGPGTNRRFSWLLVFTLIAFATAHKAHAVVREWVGADNADPTVGANWNTGGVTGTAPTAADEARFTTVSGTFPTTLNVNVSSAWNPLLIGFSAAGSPTGTFPGGNGGVIGVIPDYTFGGAGKIMIAVNGSIDTGWGQSGTVTFNNTGGIDLTRAASLSAGSHGGNSDLVIGASTPLQIGVGASSGTPSINAVGGNITINPVLSFAGNSVSRSLAIRANSGETVNLVNGINAFNGGPKRMSTLTIDPSTAGGSGGTVILGGAGIS